MRLPVPFRTLKKLGDRCGRATVNEIRLTTRKEMFSFRQAVTGVSNSLGDALTDMGASPTPSALAGISPKWERAIWGRKELKVYR